MDEAEQRNKELWMACRDGDLANVKEYLDQGANPNWIIKTYCLSDNTDIVVLYGYISAFDSSCLHIASYKGQWSVVVELLNHKDINIAVKDKNGLSPLLYAVIQDHHEISDYLIKKGATLNDNDKNCILFKACNENDLDTIKEYLDQGANPNWSVKYMDGLTPLLIACENGHHEVMDILINNGADINYKDKFGRTPLMTACSNGHHEVVDILIKNGAYINAKDRLGQTPLMTACFNGHHEVVDILIKNGADINSKDLYGETAINILENSTDIPQDNKDKCLDLLRNPTQPKDNQPYFHGRSASKQTEMDDPYFIKAISEGSGTLKPAVVVMHGPPGAGKTSVKQLLLGQPPLSRQEQNSTGVFEHPIRTCRVKSHGGIHTLREVGKEEFLQLLADNVKSRTRELKTRSSAVKTPVQKSQEHFSSPDSIPIVISTMDNHRKEQTPAPRPAPTSPTTPCHVSVPPTIKLNRVIRDIRNRLSGPRSSRADLFDLDWIYLVDSGGQPQFADILPALFQSEEALYIVVIRLDQDLDLHHNNRYCRNGETYQLPETLELTNRDLIIRACQIAEAQSTESSQKCVMIIGTCLDLVPSPDSCVDKFDKELLKIQKEYRKVVIPRDASRNKVIFAVNAMSTGQERRKFTNELQQCLIQVVKRSIKPIEVPIRWFVYELDLEEESQSSYGIVRKDKCMELGRASGLNPKEIEQSLKFFNKIAVHLYHPDIDDMVLVKMDPLTDRVSALIKTSFMPPAFKPIDDSDRLKQRGLMYKSYLRVAFEDIKDEKCISDDVFLKITEYLNVIVPVGFNEYFIPSALSVNSGCNPVSLHYTPCIFSWHDRIIPPGFFFILIVVLLLKVDEHSVPFFFLATQRHQSRDCISLSSRAYGGIVTFNNYCQKYICIYYAGGKDLNDYINVLKLVVDAMPNVIKRFTKFRDVMKFPLVSFFCSICIEMNVFHPCLLHKDRDCCFCPLDETQMKPLSKEMVQILSSLHDNIQKASYSISDHVDQSSVQNTSSTVEQQHHQLSSSFSSSQAIIKAATGSSTTISLSQSQGNSSSLGKRSSSARVSTLTSRTYAEILKKYSVKVISAVGDPNMLAMRMWAQDLIPEELKDKVTSTLGFSNNDKMTQLLNNFHKSLTCVEDIKAMTLFMKFCDVLNEQSSALNSIVAEMKKELEIG